MYRVLLVDDEPWALKDMELSFPWEKYGFHVIGSFTKADDAWQAIRTVRPDVVVTDLRMPGMSGIDLIRNAREEKTGGIFVLLSGVSDFESAQLAIRYGVVEYALKPLEETACEELVQRLAAMLEPAAEDGTVSEMMRAVQDYIDVNLHNRPTMQTVAETFHVSGNTLGRMFRAELDVTFGQYLEQRRMEYAQKLLKNRRLSIGDISEILGYSDQNYFTTCFKRRFSMTPMQYRMRGGDDLP